MLLAVSAHAQQIPAPDEQVPPEAAGAVGSKDATEPTLEGQPVPDRRQHTGAEQGQAEASQQTEESDRLAPALEAIEGALRDLKPEEDAAERQRQDEREIADLQAQQDMAFWAKAMFWATFATVIVTTVGVILILFTLHYTRKAAIYAKVAAEAAEASVGATKEIGQRQLRAYISVTSVEATVTRVRDLIDVSVRVALANRGQTPAEIRQIWIDVTTIDSEGPAQSINNFPGELELGPRAETTKIVQTSVKVDDFLWISRHGKRMGTVIAIIQFSYLDYLDRKWKRCIEFRGDVRMSDINTSEPINVKLEIFGGVDPKGDRNIPNRPAGMET